MTPGAFQQEKLMTSQEKGRSIEPKDFIAYVRQCGGLWLTEHLLANRTCSCGSCHLCMFRYAEKLIHDVAQAEAALASEREACAKVADTNRVVSVPSDDADFRQHSALAQETAEFIRNSIAADIRARSYTRSQS